MNNILVIEDDLNVQSNLVDLLTEEGYKVYTAENGEEGIKQATLIKPDIIISDVLMPKKNGFQVLTELQQNKKTDSIPFIFLTARSAQEDVRLAMREGADDYLTKPYKSTELLQAIEVRLQKKVKINQKMENAANNILLSFPHELRTPLIPIITYSEMMINDYENLSPMDLKEMAQDIHESGHNLLNLIKKFLTYAQLEAAYNLKAKDVSKNENLSSTTADIKKVILELALRYQRNNDLICEFDEAELPISKPHYELLLTEIIDNALKFSKEGSKVKIRAKNIESNYQIEIQDNGIGMSEEHITNLGLLVQFDRMKNCQNGVGLGFATVNKICEIYNLNFHVESVLKEFTKVVITIPMIKN